MRPEFVQLDRTFAEYDPDRDQEQLAQQSYLGEALGISSQLTWNELLEHGRAVVLGEAGSGKTWEFEAQVERLSSDETFAFFVRLESLAENDLSQILSSTDLERYQQWVSGTAVAFFFLDAVDESRLKSFHAFEQALANFSRSVGPAISRAQVVISARVTQWRGTTDQTLVERYLPSEKGAKSKADVAALPTSTDIMEDTVAVVQRDEPENDDEESKRSAVLVVLIVALGETEVRKFATERISAPDEFIEAIENGDAWDFARRPLDVEDLIAYWNEHGTLGNLRAVAYKQSYLDVAVESNLGEVGLGHEHSLVVRHDSLGIEHTTWVIEVKCAAARALDRFAVTKSKVPSVHEVPA